jgi:hypothetical protein
MRVIGLWTIGSSGVIQHSDGQVSNGVLRLRMTSGVERLKLILLWMGFGNWSVGLSPTEAIW